MLEKNWHSLKEEMRTEMPSGDYETWIKPIKFVSGKEDTLVLSVPTNFNQVWLEDNFIAAISARLNNLAGRMVTINVIVSAAPDHAKNGDGHAAAGGQTVISVQDRQNSFIKDHALFPNYTFDRFVVGENNALAHAAALKVASSPGTAYNPLFLYGGVGLGKTHLMHSVGNALLKKDVNLKIAYVTSEEFLNMFIDSIFKKRQEKFRNTFRNLDVLLLDDVQFLLNKTETKEELFNTFNALSSTKKQIILTSDRTPKQLQIDGLDDRLASRVGGGLDVEIRTPSLETKTAILRAKAKEENIVIPNDVYSLIADSIDTDIRLLENALNRVIAQHNLLQQEITVEMARKTLHSLISEKSPRNVSFEDILRETSNVFRLSKSDIKSKSRTSQINQARQVVMLLARVYTQMSLKEIAIELGREHPTVLSGIHRIESELKTNSYLKEKHEEIINNLKKK